MRQKIYALAFTLLITTALSRVGVRQHLQDGAVHHEDLVEFQMNQLFDLSSADQATLTYKATQSAEGSPAKEVGKIYDWKTDFHKMSYPKQQFSFIKAIDERSYILFNDAVTASYQEMSPNATLETNEWNHDYNGFGTSVVCQDANLNLNKNEILVGCISTIKSKEAHQFVLVSRVLRTNGSLVEKAAKLELTDYDIDFHNRLRMGVFNIPQGKQNKTELVVVYNQGRSNQPQTKGNANFFVLDYTAGELVFDDEEYTVELQGQTIQNVFDFFEYQGSLIVSLSLAGMDNIQLAKCQLVLGDTDVECSTLLVDTGVPAGKGYVGPVEGADLWAQYTLEGDLTQGTLRLYELNGSFGTPNWMKMIQSMAQVPAHEIEHEWIRGIEGNLNTIAIQWAGLNNDPEGLKQNLGAKDIGSVIVSWPLQLAQLSIGSSLAILGDNAFFASIGTSTVHIRRMTGAFFFTEAYHLDPQETNVLSITASDKDNSATVTAHLHSTTNPSSKIILDFQPGYLDVFGGSTLELPFTGDSWVSGNALRFNANFNDKHFKKARVIHSNATTVTFNPQPIDTHYDKIMFGEGGAVTIRATTLNYYSCDFHHHGHAFCELTFTKEIDHDARHQEGVFSKNGVVAHWSKKAGKTQVYIASFEDGYIMHEFDFDASSVSFSMDHDHDLLVAVSNYDQGTVEVWRKYADIISSWDLVENFTLEHLHDGINEFCPWQVRADPLEPTTFHALSFCKLKGNIHEITRIVSLATSYNSAYYGKSVALGSGGEEEMGVIPHFCPMGDHHIIYSHGSNAGGSVFNSLYTIDKHTSFAKYNINLQKLNFEYVEKFECFSEAEMYAIHGPAHSGTKTFGLFWAKQRYNDKKFANLIVNDLSTVQWNNLQTYFVGERMMHVGYQNQTTQSFFATLINPPKISVQVDELSTYYGEVTPVNFNIVAKSGLFKGMVNGTIYTKKANITIGYTSKKQWSPGSGWFDIEEYTRIDGPVTKVELVSERRGLSLTDRKISRGALEARDSPVVFNAYRGDVDEGIGLRVEKNFGSFVFIHDHTVMTQITRYGASRAFDFERMHLLGARQEIILYHGKDGPVDSIGVFVTRNFELTHETMLGTPRKATKIRLASYQGKRQFIGFSVDETNGEEILTVYGIKYDPIEGQLTITIIHEYEDVLDFDVCSKNGRVYLYYIQSKNARIYSSEWVFETYWTETALKPLIPDSKTQYWLKGIAASTTHQTEKIHLAINTFGTIIYTGDVDIVQGKQMLELASFIKLDKYQNFHGNEIQLNDNLVVLRAMGRGLPHQEVALVWKRQDTDGTIHTVVDVEIHDHPLPVILFKNSLYKDTVAVGTPNGEYPLNYFSIDNVRVFIPNNYENLDFSEFRLNIVGAYAQEVSVKDMFSGDTPTPTPPGPAPPGKTVGFGPFAGVLIFLLLASILWFLFGKKEEAPEEDPYMSVKPESEFTDGIFETGLRPDEVVGQGYDSEIEAEQQPAEVQDEEEVQATPEPEQETQEEEQPDLGDEGADEDAQE